MAEHNTKTNDKDNSGTEHGQEVRQEIREMNLETDHPDPGDCPCCDSIKTRALDHRVAVCFDCDAEWYIETDTHRSEGEE